MNYKDNESEQNLPRATLIKGNKKYKNSVYFIIEEVCPAIADSFHKDLLNPLQESLESLSNILSDQELVELPIIFRNLNIMNILFSILMNKDNKYNVKHISSSISCLKYIYWSKQICDEFITNDSINIICFQISNWEKIFPMQEDTYNDEISAIIDLIQIISLFIDHKDSTFSLINSILPLNFLINMAMSFKDVYIALSFSLYFYSFFDIADSKLLENYLKESISFFSFCLSCYQNGLKPAYRYNLWSLSELIIKLKQKFRLSEFIQFKLNEFINDSILEDDDKIVFPALRIISLFHFPINSNIQKLDETKENNDERQINESNSSIVNNHNNQFFIVEKSWFNIDNIVILPKYREKLSNETKIYSIMTIEKIFRYNYEYIALFFKYCMPEFYIEEFPKSDFNMKKAVCSLFLYILQFINNETLLEMIKEGLLGIFIDYLGTKCMTYDILMGVKFILDRFHDLSDYPLLVVFLQDESFQDLLSEIELNEEQNCAELATVLKNMTYIEDEGE